MSEYGARIERGQVVSVSAAGARVASLSRPGIVTPELKTLKGPPVAEGDFVYFFLFDDGCGLILDKAEKGA